jgi:CheY-like chemotaxis protein
MARVLWVDDYAGRSGAKRLGFDALMSFIEGNGHTVEIASRPEQIEEGIEHAAEFGVAIVDILMEPLASSPVRGHRFGGIDVLERLARGGSKLPVIVLSVMPEWKVSEQIQRRGIDSGAVDIRRILRKGAVLPRDLAKQVEACLRETRRARH